METYEAIREWKDQEITKLTDDVITLNDFHDQVMRKVMSIALQKMAQPTPPSSFTWFITGSGGRREQGIISDQDHGIVYEISDAQNDAYFQQLGEELSYGLFVTGYPYCQGKIMTSNPIWCKSFDAWKVQIQNWMEDESWESIRYLQIFYDARTLFGENEFIVQLKKAIYLYQVKNPILLQRFAENIKHLKSVIGPVGQILVERHGIYQGCVNLKYAAFLPYVNAIRLLSIKEGIYETSTLDRMNRLILLFGYGETLFNCEKNFAALLQYRLSLFKASSYSDTHYLNIETLSKEERKDIKRILKDGKRLHEVVLTMIL